MGADAGKDRIIEIDLARQTLRLRERGQVVLEYPVSTAANGAGEQYGSECTPRGRHVVYRKIGAGSPENSVFVGRQPTGERYSPALAAGTPGRDWILTRILWLDGCEPGRNLGGDVDTRSRHIYIHGVPDEVEMGKPGSHGCIRMRNRDVIELFDYVDEGTPVMIHG
jgi:L,D-transpeptidase YbiS